MARPSKSTLRIALLSVLLVCGGTLAYGFANAGTQTGVADRAAATANESDGIETATTTNATPTSGTSAHSLSGTEITVVATQGFYVSDERAELLAVTRNGSVVYYDDTYRVYFDVDPVQGERYTVEYVASSHFSGAACSEFEANRCTRNVVERVNLTTGDSTTVYEKLTPRVYSARWHDADRINETHLAVADIVHDRVYVVDTRTDEITWQWNASEDFPRDSGGDRGDWTHVNDVEVLADGRLMISLRNQDQVVFVDPESGLNESLTLGSDDDHETLYEQHNPDLIRGPSGEPNVLVADSENNRILEYQYSNTTWNRTWTWRDASLQWPRDADRLPNGNTLVVDTHGDRVVEVDPRDRVVWSLQIGMPYDVERLGTGDESSGPIADRRLAASRNASGHDEPESGVVGRASDRLWLAMKTLAPSLVVNGLLYVAPQWVHFSDLVFAVASLLTALAWVSLEWSWSRYSLRGGSRRLLARFR
ncbi:aryl-sulfate sulfotransferase [Haloarculaceae archaeon H-GB2-1]|nr:arylsulfotransferase family protein [Haloarculaceae archaeon H-GB1-1]MEA5387626.1 aryl-sulfate sulfotransferase [Haloarculaceae archaeon H-GB11]MEA5409114.1 aryl-sulfate sulfotransferase [Haloarculaceae archaeon H-GB2-1]